MPALLPALQSLAHPCSREGPLPCPPVCAGCLPPRLSRHLKVQLVILLPAAHWVGGKPRSAGSVDESDLSLPEERLPFTLAQVAALLTVARTGSTRSAALALSISQPAVSKSLSGLEQVSRLHCRADARPCCTRCTPLHHMLCSIT